MIRKPNARLNVMAGARMVVFMALIGVMAAVVFAAQETGPTHAGEACSTPPASTQPVEHESHATRAPAATQSSRASRDEMVRKLLGGESTVVDQVDRMLQDMGEATTRLTAQLDAGSETQAAQRRALEGLDVLIRQAGENRRASPQTSRVRPRGERDAQRRRTPDERKQTNQGKGGQAQRGGPGAAGGAGEDSANKKAAKAEMVRGWGYLPGRERDEVIQGFDEEFLAKYREQIMEYYRRLAEAASVQPVSGEPR